MLNKKFNTTRNNLCPGKCLLNCCNNKIKINNNVTICTINFNHDKQIKNPAIMILIVRMNFQFTNYTLDFPGLTGLKLI